MLFHSFDSLAGLVARIGSNTFVAVLDFNFPRPIPLASPDIFDAPDCMAIIPPHVSKSRSVEVILSCEDSLFLVDSQRSENQVRQRTVIAYHMLSCFHSSSNTSINNDDASTIRETDDQQG